MYYRRVPMRETITISLPKDMRKALDRVTKERGVSRSDVVREALRRTLFLEEFQALRERLIPLAQKQGIYTDEDVFKLVS